MKAPEHLLLRKENDVRVQIIETDHPDYKKVINVQVQLNHAGIKRFAVGKVYAVNEVLFSFTASVYL